MGVGCCVKLKDAGCFSGQVSHSLRIRKGGCKTVRAEPDDWPVEGADVSRRGHLRGGLLTRLTGRGHGAAP